MSTTKDALNNANPNDLADLLRQLGFGTVLRRAKTFLHQTAPATTFYATTDSGSHTMIALQLPDDAKASTVLRATARGGTTTGEYTSAAYNGSLSSGQVGVSPSGDIWVLASDAPTGFDVEYEPDAYDVLEVTLPVVSNALALAAFAPNVKFLMEAEATAGTSTGKKTIQGPSASGASAGAARLDVAKANVKFNSGDAVTTARVKLALVPGTDVNALLEANVSF